MKALDFFKKYWFIFAIIAIYFVLAFLNVLPRGINPFKKQNLIIDDTPVLVKEIKELGELTTCEFYGEVYADLYEMYDDIIEKYKDSIALNPQKYYQDYSGLAEYSSSSELYRNKESEYNAEREKYEIYLSEYMKKLEAIDQEKKKIKEDIDKLTEGNKERKQLEDRNNDLDKKLKNEKDGLEKIQQKYKQASDELNKRKSDYWDTRKKRNLVYIGRGWVKAGVDLKNLTEEEIIVKNGDSAEIQILINDPQIIDADINPWFIYTDKQKVMGYELFMANTGSMLSKKNFTDKEITSLKLKCKDKLREAALQKGILVNAKSSAINTLENFFGMTGFKKVKVRFKSNTIIVTKS